MKGISGDIGESLCKKLGSFCIFVIRSPIGVAGGVGAVASSTTITAGTDEGMMGRGFGLGDGEAAGEGALKIRSRCRKAAVILGDDG